MSVKFQITLSEPLMAQLKAESERAKISVAELIRQTMDDRLRRGARSQKRDPFETIDGLVQSTESDVAARIDEILYR